jgi:hypothetical protein
MENQTPKTVENVANTPKPPSRPDDTGRISVDAQVKIFDPASRKVYVEQKA